MPCPSLSLLVPVLSILISVAVHANFDAVILWVAAGSACCWGAPGLSLLEILQGQAKVD